MEKHKSKNLLAGQVNFKSTGAPPNGPRTKPKRWGTPLYGFLVELFVGTFLFCTIALVAVGMSLLVEALEKWHIDPIIVSGVRAMEFLVFFSDIALFVLFIIRSAVKTGRELWQQ